MTNKLLDELKKHFGTLSTLKNLALENDCSLFGFLLTDSKYKDEFKKRFFITLQENLIFKKDDFLQFLDLKNYGGSYTQFSSKIGLSLDDKFLINNDKVVLNFAYKDCVLKGGQSKDEQKSQEIFFNEILAREQIDVLEIKNGLCGFELVKSASGGGA